MNMFEQCEKTDHKKHARHSVNSIKAIKVYLVVSKIQWRMNPFLPSVLLVLLLFESSCAAQSIEVMDEDYIEVLNRSEYCIFNVSSIIKKVDGTLLDIVNDTGDWLLLTNGTTLFMCPTNGSYCEDDDYKPDIVLYTIQTTIYSVNFLFATCTIALHLYIKELQTVFGVLIIIFCFFLNVLYVLTFVHNRFQFTHTVDGGTVCAMFIYARGSVVFLRHSTKFIILFHFMRLMYNSYRARSGGPKFDKVLMLKYCLFICSLTTIYTLIIVPYDIAVPRDGFKTMGRYCAVSFIDGSGVYIFIAQLAIQTMVEFATFGIGMAFYFMVNKRCCEFKTSDIRVSFILVSTAGINRLSFLVYFALSGSAEYAFIASSVGTTLEQSILFFLFATSKKVRYAIAKKVTNVFTNVTPINSSSQ